MNSDDCRAMSVPVVALPKQLEVRIETGPDRLIITEGDSSRGVDITGRHNVEAFIKALCERAGFYPVNPKTIGTISSRSGFQAAYNIDPTGGAA